MSEPESVCTQIFVGVLVRFVGGGLAIVVGTGLAYWLIVGNYLEKLERFKEKLAVCKEIYKCSRNAIQRIESLKSNPEWVDSFSEVMVAFSKYRGENDLFIPEAVKQQCQKIMVAHESIVEAVSPDQYPESGAPPLQYSIEGLSNLTNEFKLLLDMIRGETEPIGFRVHERFTELYKGLVPRLPDWWRKVWTCLRSSKD